MLNELSNFNILNFKLFLEMAATGDIIKLPINFEQDDIEFLYQFPMDYWAHAMEKRYDLLFEALEELQKQRNQAGVNDLKQRIIEAYKTKNWDLVRAWTPLITSGVYENLEPLSEKEIKEMKKASEEKLNPAEIELSATRNAYDHFKKYDTEYKIGFPKDANEVREFELGERKPPKATFYAKPFLDRFYERLEKDFNSEHEKYKKILGSKAKYGFDLTNPVKEETERGVTKKRTAGMIFPTKPQIQTIISKWLTGVENRVFIPEDIKIDNLAWMPTNSFKSQFIEDLIVEEIKKLKRLPQNSQKKGETESGWDSRLRKIAEKNIQAMAQKDDLILGPKIPGHPEYSEGRKFSLEIDDKDRLKSLDRQIYLPFSQQKFPIMKKVNGKMVVEYIRQPVVGPSFYTRTKQQNANKTFSKYLKIFYEAIKDTFDFKNDDKKQNDFIQKINNLFEKSNDLLNFDMQKFIKEVKAIEKEFRDYRSGKEFVSNLEKNANDNLATIEKAIEELKSKDANEQAVGYRKNLIKVLPQDFKKSEHNAFASLHLTHSLVQRKFLDPTDPAYREMLNAVLPGYPEYDGTEFFGDPDDSSGYDGPGVMYIKAKKFGEEIKYTAVTVTKKQMDEKGIPEDIEYTLPGQFSILLGITKCFNGKPSACTSLREKFEKQKAIDEDYLSELYEKILKDFLTNLANRDLRDRAKRIEKATFLSSTFLQAFNAPRKLRASRSPAEEDKFWKDLAAKRLRNIPRKEVLATGAKTRWELYLKLLEENIYEILNLSSPSPSGLSEQEFDRISPKFDAVFNKWREKNVIDLTNKDIDLFFDELTKISKEETEEDFEDLINRDLIITKAMKDDESKKYESYVNKNYKKYTRDYLKTIADPSNGFTYLDIIQGKQPPQKPRRKATTSGEKKATRTPKLLSAEQILQNEYQKFEKGEIKWEDFILQNLDLMISMDQNVLKQFVSLKKYQIKDQDFKILVDVYRLINFIKTIDFKSLNPKIIKDQTEKALNFQQDYLKKKIRVPSNLMKQLTDKLQKELDDLFSTRNPKDKLAEIYNALIAREEIKAYLNQKNAVLGFLKS